MTDDNISSDKFKIEEIKSDDMSESETSELNSQPSISKYELIKNPKQYTNLEKVYIIFGRKYYFIPEMKSINDDIKLLDGDQKVVPYDIRTLSIEPYQIEIKTYFNENNQNVLTDKFNELVKVVWPKYEHFINFSKFPKKTFITCFEDQDPVQLNCSEINVNHQLVKNGKVLEEKTLY